MTTPTLYDYTVQRYGGRACDEWKVRFRGTSEEAWKRYDNLRLALRQGGLRLVAPNGDVLARCSAPRLRTRW